MTTQFGILKSPGRQREVDVWRSHHKMVTAAYWSILNNENFKAALMVVKKQRKGNGRGQGKA